MGSHPVELFSNVSKDIDECLGSGTSLAFQSGVGPGPEASPTQVAAYLLHKNLLKKFTDSTGIDADSKALTKFLDANERCRNYRISCESWEDELVGTFKKVAYEFYLSLDNMGLLSYNEILSRGRMGPGSSIASLGTDIYSKMFASRLTYTNESLLQAYKLVGCQTPRWKSAEIIRAELLGDGLVRTSSKLSFVPKTTEISRTICTEPSLNMYYQLGLGSVLEVGLRRFFGIDLSTQPDRNAWLAWSGSLTGLYGSIDLESASDSVSLGMLKSCLPRQLYSILESLRTPSVELPSGEQVPLHMVSTMGNGFTFPLQTMIFACVVRAVYLELGISKDRTIESGVFGDDIIVCAQAYRKVCRLLEILGFRVNSTKSFNDGYFRESCGSDYFRGQNVRAVYLKTLKTKQDRYSAFNRLALWSSRHFALPNALSYLLRTVPLNEVPVWESQTSGIAVPWADVRDRKYDKWTRSPRFWRWEPVPREILFEDGVKPPKGHKQLQVNEPGAEMAFLAGAIRSNRIMVRHDQVRWRRRSVVCPDWDNYSQTGHFSDARGWQRWGSAVSDVMSQSTRG